jgi:hypothetical protein
MPGRELHAFVVRLTRGEIRKPRLQRFGTGFSVTQYSLGRLITSFAKYTVVLSIAAKFCEPVSGNHLLGVWFASACNEPPSVAAPSTVVPSRNMTV